MKKIGIVSIFIFSFFIFFLPAKAASPYIEVLSPNGGEKYIAGEEMEITWKQEDVDSVIINKCRESDCVGPNDIKIAEINTASTSPEGSYTWLIPADHYPYKDNFKIKVTGKNGAQSASDLSDDFLQIERVISLINAKVHSLVPETSEIYQGQKDFRFISFHLEILNADAILKKISIIADTPKKINVSDIISGIGLFSGETDKKIASAGISKDAFNNIVFEFKKGLVLPKNSIASFYVLADVKTNALSKISTTLDGAPAWVRLGILQPEFDYIKPSLVSGFENSAYLYANPVEIIPKPKAEKKTIEKKVVEKKDTVKKETPVKTKKPVIKVDKTFSKKMEGKILLQAEASGEAWYVNPKTLKRHYLGRPRDAFEVMAKQGVGIKNSDLNKIPLAKDSLQNLEENDSDSDGYIDEVELKNDYNPFGKGKLKYDENFAAKQKGKILLQVESRGEAWYVNPGDGLRYYLGSPIDAFNMMRKLSLGITEKDINKIDIEN